MITKSTISKIPLIIALTATAVMGLATIPANARQISTGSTSFTKSELEDDGYSCEVVSLGLIECTKDGEDTYWCSAGTCIVKPRITGGASNPWTTTTYTQIGASNQLATTVYTPTAPSTPKPVFTTIFATIMIAR